MEGKKVISSEVREGHKRLAAAYKEKAKWNPRRNAAAFDIFVRRAKLFAKARGMKDPFVVMPKIEGTRQRGEGKEGYLSSRPVVIEQSDLRLLTVHLKERARSLLKPI